MRELAFIVIFGLVVSQSLAIPKCPSTGGEAGDILLPNPADCTSYYMCLNGIPYQMPCSPGLHWNDASKRCDYPEIAQCKETEEKPTTVKPTTSTAGSTTSSKPRPDKCPAENGPEDVLLPNPADCGSFFKCLDGVPHLIKCPSGQHWSIDLNRCDYPEIAKCVETETSLADKPTTAGPTSSKPPVVIPDKCPAENGPGDVLLPNPEDCGSFFKCLNGEPILIQCPAGQQWSIELSRCDFPEIAKCQPKTFIKLIYKDSDCPLHNSGYDILSANPEDCTTYFQCSNGEKILMKCPEGTLWDVIMNRCDHAHLATCA